MKITVIILSLVLTGLLLFSCKKQNSPISRLSYTYNMAGMHSWAGMQYDYTSVFATSPDTVVNFSEDSAAIIVVNDTTIVFIFDTLKYFASNYKDTIAFAVGGYDSSSAFLYDTIWYNYSTNMITYHYRFASLLNPYFETYFYDDAHTRL